MRDIIARRFAEAADVLSATREHLAQPLEQAARLVADCLRAGQAVFTLGNGGSAADAQHIAGELVGRFLVDRPPLRAEALSTDTSVLTAVANDYGYENVFARQLAGKARRGDVVIALSTSGDSPNVLAALKQARQMGCRTIAFTGRGGGQCAGLADVLLDVPATLSPRIQEAHALMYHILCELVEAELAG